MNLFARKTAFAIALATFTTATSLAADPPVIEQVSAAQTTSGWQFSVTLSHGDTGWDDYADGWRVLDMDGNALGLRTLHHPHVEEQPFTRSLSGVSIPSGTREVQIEARDNVGGWSGQRVVFKLP